jgi:Ca2+-binding RTX toxin-like protein
MTSYIADSEIIVTQTDQNAVYTQSVTSLEEGYVVVWYAADTAETGWLEGDLYAQRFDDYGQPVGDAVLVNTTTMNDQYGGNTIALGDGGFVVTWVSAEVADEIDGLQTGVVTGQRFDASGAKVGGEVEFGSCDTNSPPYIVGLDSGGVVVYWTNYVDGVPQLYAQALDADGEADGGPQVIKQGLTLNSIANIGGNIIATFSDGDIRVCNLGTSGLGNGDAALVNSGYTADDQFLSHVAGLGNGKYVVVWTSYGQDGDASGIFQQIYNADGSKYGAMSQVNTTTTGSQYYSQVTALANGEYIIVYSSPDGSYAGVFAQIFDATGQKLGAEFMINTTTAGSQTLPTVISGENGFAVYWSGVDADGFGQLYQRNYHVGLTLTGTANADVLTGGDYADELSGLAGNDVLNGGAGADSMAGGTGNDTYYVDNAGDTVSEGTGAGTDLVNSSITYTLSANVENLKLTGSANLNGNGNGLNNILTGNSGNNILNGGTGADTMLGGAGNDTYYVDNTGDRAYEFTTGNVDTGGVDRVYSTVNFTLGAYVENLTLTSSANLSGNGNDLNNVLTGNSGNNVLNGMAGADTMLGGAGNDTYYVDNIGDKAYEFSSGNVDTGGLDRVYSSVSYNIGQYIENLTLTGTSNINGSGNDLNNILTGNAGNNVLNGGAGADVMIGGAGNDTYYVDDINDKAYDFVTGGIDSGGNDTVISSASFHLSNFIETLTLAGSGNINGVGNGSDNTIAGNSGNNILNGLGGHDVLSGGAGADIFLMQAGCGADTITDFSSAQNDKINLHAFDQGTAVFSQVGSDTVIDLGGGNVVTILNTTATDPALLNHIVW